MYSKAENEIVIYPSRVVAIISTIGCFLFVVGGIILIIDSPSTEQSIAGWACILFFGWCGCKYFKMVVPNRPILIVNDNGLYYKDIGLIKWEYITLVRTYQFKGETVNISYFSVIAKDSYMSSLSTSRRTLSSLNSALGGPGVINIPSYIFNIPINDLARMIHQRYGVNISLEIAD